MGKFLSKIWIKSFRISECYNKMVRRVIEVVKMLKRIIDLYFRTKYLTSKRTL